MKSPYQKMLGSLTVAAGLVCVLSAPLSAQAFTAVNGGGFIPTPDAGASFVLLALGCSGLAIAARKCFKR